MAMNCEYLGGSYHSDWQSHMTGYWLDYLYRILPETLHSAAARVFYAGFVPGQPMSFEYSKSE